MRKIVPSLVLLSVLLLPVVAQAIPIDKQQPVNTDLIGVLNNIIGWALGILIAFAVLMLIVAGFYFVTAQGDSEKLKTARAYVLWALVGVAVGLVAFAAVQFIQTKIVV